MYPITFTSSLNITQITLVLSEARYADRHRLLTLSTFYMPDKTDTIFKVTFQLLQNQLSLILTYSLSERGNTYILQVDVTQLLTPLGAHKYNLTHHFHKRQLNIPAEKRTHRIGWKKCHWPVNSSFTFAWRRVSYIWTMFVKQTHLSHRYIKYPRKT